jgi:hypothetical protein
MRRDEQHKQDEAELKIEGWLANGNSGESGESLLRFFGTTMHPMHSLPAGKPA